MSEWECARCGGNNTVAVWENKKEWKKGLEPDFIGCHDCHIMEQ